MFSHFKSLSQFIALFLSSKTSLKYLYIQLFHVLKTNIFAISILCYIFIASPSFLKLSFPWFLVVYCFYSHTFLSLSLFLTISYIAPSSFLNVEALPFSWGYTFTLNNLIYDGLIAPIPIVLVRVQMSKGHIHLDVQAPQVPRAQYVPKWNHYSHLFLLSVFGIIVHRVTQSKYFRVPFHPSLSSSLLHFNWPLNLKEFSNPLQNSVFI